MSPNIQIKCELYFMFLTSFFDLLCLFGLLGLPFCAHRRDQINISITDGFLFALPSSIRFNFAQVPGIVVYIITRT